MSTQSFAKSGIFRGSIIGCLIFLLLPSCISNVQIKAQQGQATPEKKVGNITLQSHQMVPIQFLLDHPEQKGLLLAHYLGTGKTFTALGFAELNPEKNIVILAPEILRSNWQSHMNRMGLKNPGRYKFLSFEEASTQISPHNLKNSILIIDEVHHFVHLLKSGSKKMRSQYTKLYQNLTHAQRILALSGTPIFGDVSDLSYILNLVSGDDLLPVNERAFLDQYTKIEKSRAFWRGHISESHTMIFGLPFVVAAIPLAFITPYVGLVSAVYFGGLGVGFLSLPLLNNYLSPDVYPLRRFDAAKLKDVSSKYVSYFDFRESPAVAENYPTKKIHVEKVPYNDQQIGYFLEFADVALNQAQLARLAREHRYDVSGDFVLESSAMQTEIRQIDGSGKEIGNFHFADANQHILEAPKFEAVYQRIKEKPHGVVVYSAFFENGIKLFAEFLDRKGLQGSYRILRPEMSVAEHMAMIDAYNNGKFDILLLHPDFVEGISLEGTRSLHILEPPPSVAITEQIIGRTIRLNSHARLPKKDRHVDIYTWESTLSGMSAFLAKNANWALRFNELNSIAAFGTGQAQIDPNHFMKAMSPDEFATHKSLFIQNAMSSLKELLSKNSIEGHKND